VRLDVDGCVEGGSEGKLQVHRVRKNQSLAGHVPRAECEAARRGQEVAAWAAELVEVELAERHTETAAQVGDPP
jgi:hypothetical protein